MDVRLSAVPDTTADPPVWAAPLFYSDSFNAEENAAGEEVEIDVPPGLSRVVMIYTSTGHCTDGRDEDEFVSKANVISVDGVVVERFHPWRTDCGENRAINPYCSRWTDGSWSSDYKRSGWCPGREVVPREIDLSDALKAGHHRVRFAIEGMRPKDADGNYGYWRVSASLAGWDHEPKLWRNLSPLPSSSPHRPQYSSRRCARRDAPSQGCIAIHVWSLFGIRGPGVSVAEP